MRIKQILVTFLFTALVISCGNSVGTDANSSKKKSTTKTTKSTKTTKAASPNGTYTYSESNGVKLSIRVSGAVWSGSTKICSYCETEYDRGIVRGNDLYDQSGYAKIGYISGNSLYTKAGSSSVTLTK